MSKNSLVRHRADSFHRQSGRCFYCGVPMWLNDCKSFAVRYHLGERAAKLLQCTTEHLTARRDGGADDASNIVAACRRCNLKRHSRKTAPGPKQYRKLVRKKVLRGKWHDSAVYESGLLLSLG